MRNSSSIKIVSNALVYTFVLLCLFSFSYHVFADTAGQPAATTQTTQTNTSAQTTNTPFVPLTQLPGIQSVSGASTLPTFFNYIYKICIGAAAVIAVIEIMIAGGEFMISRGSISSNEKAKSRIQNAILGLVLVLSPTIFFGIINPKILNLDFTSDIGNLKLNAITPQSTTVTSGTASCGTGTGVVTGTAANACSTLGSNYSSVDASCCSGMVSGNTCCALTNAQKYQLAGYYTKQNKNTGYQCYVSLSTQYGSVADCNAGMAQAKNDLAAQSSDTTTYSSYTFVQSCVVTNNTNYTVSAPNNLPLCPN